MTLLYNKVPSVLRSISNPLRYNMINVLRHEKNVQYSHLMRGCGLDPLSQTGIFNYHISHMLRMGIIMKDMNGMYSLTDLGAKLADFLVELEKAYPIVFRYEAGGGEKLEKVKTCEPEKESSEGGNEFVHLTMHHSGLYYMQTDLDPEDVRSIVFLSYEGGKVADIVPIFKTKIYPDSCTSIEDVKELIDQWHDSHPEDKGSSAPHIYVVIEIII